MTITVQQLKENFDYYLDFVEEGNKILIENNGKIIAEFFNPIKKKIEALYSLISIAGNNDISLDDIKIERLQRQ